MCFVTYFLYLHVLNFCGYSNSCMINSDFHARTGDHAKFIPIEIDTDASLFPAHRPLAGFQLTFRSCQHVFVQVQKVVHGAICTFSKKKKEKLFGLLEEYTISKKSNFFLGFPERFSVG